MTRGRWVLAAAILATVAGGLAGCSQSDPSRVEYRCGSLSEDGTMFASVEEARASGMDLCRGVFAEDLVLNETEKQAVLAAYGSAANTEGLATLYGICAQRTATILADTPTPLSDEQAAELGGALLLCPDHPDREALEAATARP